MEKSSKLLNKKKQRKDSSESEGDQESLSDIEYGKSDKKKVEKSEEKPKKSRKKSDQSDDGIIVGKDEVTFMLNQKKRLNVRKFKGNVLVDIREFWSDDSGSWKPGKKGISLTLENWNKVKYYMDNIDEAIKNMK